MLGLFRTPIKSEKTALDDELLNKCSNIIQKNPKKYRKETINYIKQSNDYFDGAKQSIIEGLTTCKDKLIEKYPKQQEIINDNYAILKEKVESITQNDLQEPAQEEELPQGGKKRRNRTRRGKKNQTKKGKQVRRGRTMRKGRK